MNLTRNSKLHHQVKKTKLKDGCRFCPNVTFKDNEFKDNKKLNDQGNEEGTIFVTAQLNHELELDLIMVRNSPPPPPSNF
jgi:hypothetical protein